MLYTNRVNIDYIWMKQNTNKYPKYMWTKLHVVFYSETDTQGKLNNTKLCKYLMMHSMFKPVHYLSKRCQYPTLYEGLELPSVHLAVLRKLWSLLIIFSNCQGKYLSSYYSGRQATPLQLPSYNGEHE